MIQCTMLNHHQILLFNLEKMTLFLMLLVYLLRTTKLLLHQQKTQVNVVARVEQKLSEKGSHGLQVLTGFLSQRRTLHLTSVINNYEIKTYSGHILL